MGKRPQGSGADTSPASHPLTAIARDVNEKKVDMRIVREGYFFISIR